MDNKKISVGKKIKEAREKKALAIDQVQKATKIHSTVLIAIEEGRANELLTDTYVRSFLKKYSQFLGLNSVDILKEYFPAYPESAPVTAPVRENSLPKETTVPPKFLYITGIAIAVIIAIALLSFIVGKIASSFKKPGAAIQKSVTAPKKKTAQTSKTSSKKKTAAKTRSGSKELVPRSSPLSLVIKVKESVLVGVKRDGVLLFETVMNKGTVETIVAKETIDISIVKPNALGLTLNGRPILVPNKKGISGLEITRKGVRIR